MLQSFCCGCPLRRGAYIIGILSICGAIGNILESVIVQGNGIFNGDWFIIVGLISSIVVIISAALVVIAASKNKPLFLLPWLVLTVIGIFGALGFMGLTIYQIATTSNRDVVLAILLVSFILGIGLSIYFWLVVFSFYKELKSTINSTSRNPTARVAGEVFYPEEDLKLV